MGLLQRRPCLDHLVERPRLDVFLDARELRVLQRHLRQHAERPETDARGVEERAVARGAAIEDPVIRGRDAEPDHAAVQRFEAPAGPVRPGRERTGERLLVDVGKVRHLLADRGERRADVAEARPGPKRRPQLGRVVRDETGHAVEREQRPVGRHEARERVTRTDRTDRARRAREHVEQLFLALRRGALRRVGVLETRPVAPDEVSGGVLRRRVRRLAIARAARGAETRTDRTDGDRTLQDGSTRDHQLS